MIMAVICCILGMRASAQDRTLLVGTDITSVIRDLGAGIRIGCMISGKWSVSALAYIYPAAVAREMDSYQNSHYGHLGYDFPEGYDTDIHRTGIFIRYWPHEAFSGPLIGLGMVNGARSGTDCCIEAGWMIRIWKGTALSITHTTDIVGTSKRKRLSGREISIGINYIF